MSLNLACILETSAGRYADQAALLHRDRAGQEVRVRYRELRDAARRVAGALSGLGVRPGDKVALMVPNLPEFTIAYFGILYAGATVVPLNTLFVEDEIAYHLEDSDAVLLIAWEGYEEAVRAGVERVPGCRELVLVMRDAEARPAGARSFTSLLTGGRADMAQTMPDDTAVILYTSGTTGRPKGAELTHFNLYANAQWCSERSQSIVPHRMMVLGPGQVALAALPLFHSYGQTCMQNGMLFNGGALAYLSRWDPEEALRLMEALGVTYFAGVPTMYFGLLHAPGGEGRDLRKLAYCSSGGAPMPVEMMREFEERYPVQIMEGYGLSETSPVATFHTPEFERRPGTVGKAIDGCEVQIFDDSDNPAPTGEVGEVVIRGQNIFKGYYKRPEATAEAMRGGWFHSGDLGRVDDEGYVQIVDRKKDMILRGGFNVYPREIEEVLYAHPAIREAAVIGIPDAEHGEEVVAVVAIHEESGLTAAVLIEYCKKHMAPYKYPRRVEFRDSLPKGGTGKILKRVLRDEL